MALPATIDSLDAVPEALRQYYVPSEDGRFRLDAEGVEDVTGLKSALEKERAARKALKAALEAASGPQDGDAGSEADPDPAEETAPVPGAGPSEPVPSGDPGARATGSDDAPAPASEPAPEDASGTDTVAALRAQLEARLIEAEASAAVIAASGVPELLLPVLLPRLGVRETAEGFEVRVLPAADGAVPPASLAALVEELRRSEIYGRAFAGSGKSGSGAPAAAAGSGGPVSLPAGDPLTLGRHIADIAAGRVTVDG